MELFIALSISSIPLHFISSTKKKFEKKMKALNFTTTKWNNFSFPFLQILLFFQLLRLQVLQSLQNYTVSLSLFVKH